MARIVSQNPVPETESTRATSLKTSALTRAYPDKLFRGLFDNYTADTVDYQPQDLGKGQSCVRHVFEIGNECYHFRTSDTWTLDLTETTIDLDTFVGGIVDDIAFENDRDYLIWAFLDENFEWAGMGVTRKPYSAFSAIGGGSAPKGTTRNFVVVDAYQFTIGSRVVVRNTVGTAPEYEWNWGTVTVIIDSVTITIVMDNQTYGTSITGVTNGEIKQWNMFRPFVVSSTEQVLYTSYYSLVGEIYTDSTSGNIKSCYRADDPFRPIVPIDIFNDVVTTTPASFSAGRYAPLWSVTHTFIVLTSGTGEQISINGAIAGDIIVYANVDNNAFEGILNNSVDNIYTINTNTGSANGEVAINGYNVPSGMRG